MRRSDGRQMAGFMFLLLAYFINRDPVEFWHAVFICLGTVLLLKERGE